MMAPREHFSRVRSVQETDLETSGHKAGSVRSQLYDDCLRYPVSIWWVGCAHPQKLTPWCSTHTSARGQCSTWQ